MLRFRLGAFLCTALNDGTADFRARSFCANAPRDELIAALGPGSDPDMPIPTPFHCLLVQTGAHTVLIDTGMGPRGETVGQLGAQLAAAGIVPEQIDAVILSHAHPDHCGGAVSLEGTPVFSRARHLITQTEWDFWHSPAAEHPLMLAVPQIVRPLLEALAPCIERVPPEGPLLPGLSAIAAPGHTPGQIAVLVESEGARLIFTADAVAHRLHLSHPEWTIRLDVDPVQAVRTRRALLDRAADEGILGYSYHLTPPGPYRVRRAAIGWAIENG